MQLGDTFQLEYCPKVKFKLKRIDKQTKILWLKNYYPKF